MQTYRFRVKFIMMKYYHSINRFTCLSSVLGTSVKSRLLSSRVDTLRDKLLNDDSTLNLYDFANSHITPKKSIISRQALKPSWIKAKPATSSKYNSLRSTVRELGLSTVCEEAKCPNIGECWGGNSATATIMIMGDTCTRGCSFCAVKTSGKPLPLQKDEPERVAEAVARWGLDYVVLTSVDRDDLNDYGASHFRSVIKKLIEIADRERKVMYVEALTPDFRGELNLVTEVATSGLDVYAHNIETVKRLQRRVRDFRATYEQSLSVLEHVKYVNNKVLTKTSLMLGLSETDEEIRQTLCDLRSIKVDIVTFGQYLQPTPHHLNVKNYLAPSKYEEWGEEAKKMGFKYVASGPMVRSSYKAGELFVKNLIEEQKLRESAN